MNNLKRNAVLTDTDLNQSLLKFKRTTRLAILLTLTLEISPKEVEQLTWNEVKALSLSAPAIKILNLIPRHIHSNLVFWNVIGNSVEPLRYLSDNINLVKGDFTLTKFRLMFKNILYIEESSKAFIRIMNK